MPEYPINIFTCNYRDDLVRTHDKIDEFGKNGCWSELLEILNMHKDLINSSKLPVKNKGQPPSLLMPLHYAAFGGAPKEIFEQLIKFGAYKCMKTAAGKTAYDIAKRKGLNPDILELLEISEKVKQNSIEIENMEKGLHKVIRGRVEKLIEDNGQSLPQLALLYEKGSFYYPVPGMYGGFSVSEHEKGIQADSFIRVCGGSEQNHVIDRKGNIKLLRNDNPL